MYKRVHVVVSSHGVVYGVYSEMDLAMSCLRHYEKLFPNSSIEVFSKIVDLVKYETLIY